jgi:hypothetical protein
MQTTSALICAGSFSTPDKNALITLDPALPIPMILQDLMRRFGLKESDPVGASVTPAQAADEAVPVPRPTVPAPNTFKKFLLCMACLLVVVWCASTHRVFNSRNGQLLRPGAGLAGLS